MAGASSDLPDLSRLSSLQLEQLEASLSSTVEASVYLELQTTQKMDTILAILTILEHWAISYDTLEVQVSTIGVVGGPLRGS